MKASLRVLLGLGAFIGLAVAPACAPGFPGVVSTQRLKVTLVSGNDTGEPSNRLAISFTTPQIFTVDVEADDINGALDTSFNGYVRASVVPGTVLSVTGPRTTGRNVLLKNGQAKGIQIAVLEAYGNTNIWIDDVGYVPADPLGKDPPKCANGLDDNHNGKVDYPVDPGCYAANDDTEDGGTYAAAVTDTLYFQYPRIADVRGVNNGGVTPFNNQQLSINTEWTAPDPSQKPSGVVVTGVSSSGFYATDLTDTRGYSSVYAYNYTAPPIMLPCDRLITLGGTAGDFYGYTEINFPTWSLEEWDPLSRGCWVPDATPLIANDFPSTGASPVLLNLEAALVQVSTVPVVSTSETTNAGKTTTADTSVATSLHIAGHFGPGLVPGNPSLNQADYVPSATASDCDYNGDGKIEFLTNCGPAGDQPCPEDLCSTACTADPECSEYSAFLTESQFRLVVESTTTTTTTVKTTSGTMPPVVVVGPKVTGSVQGVGSADANFDPVSLKGQELGGFTGNLLYFSGGSQFTIQARCADDIVTNSKHKPLPTSCPSDDTNCHAACVVKRNAADQTNAN